LPGAVALLSAGVRVNLKSRSVAIFAVLCVVLTLAVGAAVATRTWDIGVEGEWVWAYHDGPPHLGFSFLALPVLCVAAMAVIVVIGGRAGAGGERPRQAAAVLAVMLFLCAWGLFVVLPAISPAFTYEGLVANANPFAGGYFFEAAHRSERQSLPAYLRGYAARIAALEVKGPLGHVADHPPGAIVVHWGLNRLMAAHPALAARFWPETPYSARLAPVISGLVGKDLGRAEMAGLAASMALFRLAAAVTLLLLYFLARLLLSDRDALLACGLCALIPSLHLFGPYPDQLFPPIAVSAVLASELAWRRRSAAWAAAAGAALFVGLQFTLAFLAVGGLIAVSLVLHFVAAGREERPGSRRAVFCLLGGLAGLLVPALLVWVGFRYNSFAVWKVCYVNHASFAQHFPRSYWKWLLATPVEVAVFTGVPISLAFLWRLVGTASGWRRSGQPLDVMSWSLVILLALLVLSGKNLGETARLWIGFMPFAAIGAAAALARCRCPVPAGVGVLALMFFQLICFRASLNVFGV